MVVIWNGSQGKLRALILEATGREARPIAICHLPAIGNAGEAEMIIFAGQPE